MITVIINTLTSYRAAEATIAIFDTGFKVKTAQIIYNLNKGLPLENQVEDYPLTLEGDFNGCPFQIKVGSVTAGYNGNGPNDMLKILNAADFKFHDISPILTDCWANFQGQINITCNLDGTMVNNLA